MAIASPASPRQPEKAKTVLKPGFVATPNRYYLEIAGQLNLAELRLLNVLIYFTNGFLRHWCLIGEEALLRYTNISRSSLYAAKKSLEDRGLISVQRTRRACLYSLGEPLQVLDDPKSEPPSRRPMNRSEATMSECSDLTPSVKSEPLDSCREEQDFNKHVQHHPTTSTQPKSADDETSSSKQGGLVAQLVSLGVHDKVAARLVRTQAEETIQTALQRLKVLVPHNPAGYLVAEISRGGYSSVIDRTKAQRLLHAEVKAQRELEKDRQAIEQQKSQQKVLSALEAFERLPSGVQASLLSQLHEQAEKEGFTRVRGWGEEHPVYRGLLAELISASIQAEGNPETSRSQTEAHNRTAHPKVFLSEIIQPSQERTTHSLPENDFLADL